MCMLNPLPKLSLPLAFHGHFYILEYSYYPIDKVRLGLTHFQQHGGVGRPFFLVLDRVKWSTTLVGWPKENFSLQTQRKALEPNQSPHQEH